MRERDLSLRWTGSKGFNRILELNNRNVPSIGFGVLKAAGGDTFEFKTDLKEVCLVILSGNWRARINTEEPGYTCGRTSVFDEKPCAFYLPPHNAIDLRADKAGTIAFCESWGSSKGKPLFIPASSIKERSHGGTNCRRTAFDIIDDAIEANRLLVGETISEPGNWSSFPPHKHDTDNLPQESALEELYFFMFNPEGGFGFQRVYTDDRALDESFLLEDGCVVTIPRGYHPVVSAPGYSHYYLWVLAGRQRMLRVHYDVRYSRVGK